MTLSLLNAALILSVLTAAHWYLWRRLVRDCFPERNVWRRSGTVVIGLLAAATAGAAVSGPAGTPFAVVRVLAWPGQRWLSLLLYLALALLLGELARPVLRRLAARRTGAAPPAGAEGGPSGDVSAEGADTTRRLFVARTVAVGATTLAAGVTYAESMADDQPTQGPGTQGVDISLPFTGTWLTRNSPARRVPSHGTDLFGGRYAIDFIAVDDRHRTAGSRSWRTLFATEPPELFFAFGQPLLAPGNGTVVHVHDGEIDHEARRSQLALVPYALGQAGRAREGANALAGNHVVISLAESETFVTLAHLRAGSPRVSVGQKVVEGEHIADCGNSGNSTQPHVHMQITDGADMTVARGVPMLFRRFREWPSGPDRSRVRERTVPGEGAVVEPLAARRS